jgi:hypothetical protein
MDRQTTHGTTAHLLRVALPDRPGSLGELAAAIGRAGADIVSFDIVERLSDPVGGDTVVDDFVVVLGAEPAAGLRADLGALDGLIVETLRPYTGIAGAGELDHYDAAVHGGSSGAALSLIASVGAQAFKADWALVLERGPAGVTAQHGTTGAPRLRWADLPWLPMDGPARLDPAGEWVPSEWTSRATALAAAPIDGTDLVLLVARPGGPDFRDCEVARLGRLATVAAVASTRDGRFSYR